MEVFLLILRLVLAGVFCVAGMAKLFDPAGSEKAFADFGVPKSIAKTFVYLLPAIELLIAVSLLFVSTSWFAAIGASGILTIFTVAMLYQMAKGNAPDCHCFGQIHSEPVGRSSVLRNAAMIALAGFLVVQGQSGQGFSLIRSDQDVLTVVLGLTIVAMLSAGLMFLKRISDQQTQIMRRIELMELVARDGGTVEREEMSHPHEGLPIGAVVSDFAVPNLRGEVFTLADVRADNKPTLFVFISPNCTPCKALIPEFEQWQTDLGGKVELVFVSSGKADENAEKFAGPVADSLLLQKDREFAELVKARWTPTAVLMDANGRIASHVAAGDTAIRALVGQVKNEDLSREFAYFTNGNGHSHTTKIGESVPQFSVVDISGHEITSDYFRNKQTLVAFWSLTCGYCEQMIDDLREWDKTKGMDAPGLIVFSDGDDEANEILGLKSPVVTDAGHKTSAGFGMFGTPSAVLVNEEGKIVSETAVGASDIWSLIGKRK